MAGEHTNLETSPRALDTAQSKAQAARDERMELLKQYQDLQNRQSAVGQSNTEVRGRPRGGNPETRERDDRRGEEPMFRVAENFLKAEGVTEDNQENLHIGTVIKFLAQQSPPAPELGMLQDALAKVDPWGEKDIFNEIDDKVFNSRVENLIRGHEMPDAEARSFRVQMSQAHEKYQQHYKYFRQILATQKSMGDLLQREKEQVGTSATEDLAGVVDNVKRIYPTLKPWEKAVAIGGPLILAGLFLSSDSPYVERFKELIGNCLKIALGAVIVNVGTKALTGTSALDLISQSVSTKATSPESWQKVYKTNAERVGVLRDSVPYLGNYEFGYLAEKYREANRTGKKEIDLPSMNPSDMNSKQVYIAIDVFMNKYGTTHDKMGHTVNVEDTYKNWNPPATWVQAISNEMIRHNDIDIGSSVVGDVASRVAGYAERGYYATAGALSKGWDKGGEYAGKAWDKGKEYAEKGYDAFDTGKIADYTKRGSRALGKGVGTLAGGVVAGAGIGVWNVLEGGAEGLGAIDKDQSIYEWAKSFYQRNFGNPGDDPKIKAYMEQTIERTMITPEEFPNYIKSKANISPETAQGFINAFNAPPSQKDSKIQISKDTKKEGSLYLIASRPGVVAEGAAGYQKGIDETDRMGREFLKNYLKTEYNIDVGDQIDKFVQLHKVVYVNGATGVAKALIRMPLPNTQEWNRRQLSKWGEGVEAGREIFGTNDKIDYDKMRPWEKLQFRLRFFVDQSQKKEIKQICERLGVLYQGIDKEAALKRPFEKSNNDLTEVKDYLHFEEKLAKARLHLESLEPRINQIEDDVSSRAAAPGDEKNQLLTKIQRDFGFIVRLAVLGDSEALQMLKTSAFTGDPAKDEEAFLKWYSDTLMDTFVKKK